MLARSVFESIRALLSWFIAIFSLYLHPHWLLLSSLPQSPRGQGNGNLQFRIYLISDCGSVSRFTPICCQRKTSDVDWTRHQSVNITEEQGIIRYSGIIKMAFVSYFILVSSVWLYPRFLGYPVLDPWTSRQSMTWGTSCAVGLNLSQTLIGHTQKFSIIIAHILQTGQNVGGGG